MRPGPLILMALVNAGGAGCSRTDLDVRGVTSGGTADAAEPRPDAPSVVDGGARDVAVDHGVRDVGEEPDAALPRGCSASGQTVLAKGESFPTGIGVDATHLYWATVGSGGSSCQDGQIRALPKGGGPIATLAGQQSNPRALVVDASFVYWYDGCGTGKLRRVPVGGGPVFDYPIQGDPTEDARVLAQSRQSLYFNSYGVLGIPKGGGPQFVVDDTDYVYGVAADDLGVYWAGPIGGGPAMAVFALPQGATAPAMLVQQSVGEPVAIDATWVYFESVGIQRVPRTGGAVETIVPTANAGYAMAVSGGSLYWLEGNASLQGYRVHKTPAGGGADDVLAQGAGWAFQLALDDDCVYWTNPGAGTIEAAPR